jgi:isoquinoline 1-oxidoreductase subunit beta
LKEGIMIPLNPSTLRPSRRSLLTGALIGGAFVLGFQPKAQAQTQTPGGPGLNPFQAYLRIAPDGRVTVISAHFDMGQGIYHGLATLAAEELSVPLSQVSVEGGASNPRAYGNIAAGGAFQFTGGSTGIPSSWERYRRAGASAREMLRSAAAAAWNVPVSEVRAENGQLTAGNRRAGYGDMIAAAARLPVPSNVALKPASQWTLIGKTPAERFDSRDKTNGSQIYTLDMRLPGMLIAVVAHPPRFGGTVQSFDAAKARAVRGVVDVVQIPRGVAVVAETTWAAIKGREALTVSGTKRGRRSVARLICARPIWKQQTAQAQKPPIAAMQMQPLAAPHA